MVAFRWCCNTRRIDRRRCSESARNTLSFVRGRVEFGGTLGTSLIAIDSRSCNSKSVSRRGPVGYCRAYIRVRLHCVPDTQETLMVSVSLRTRGCSQSVIRWTRYSRSWYARQRTALAELACARAIALVRASNYRLADSNLPPSGIEGVSQTCGFTSHSATRIDGLI